MEVELEVVGKHAMLFDDDATSAFVNSKEALIEWNFLFIDRFDVRNLLSDPPPSFRKLPGYGGPSPDSHLESQLDLERYADLPSSDEQEIENEVARTDASGYHFVPFSYGNSAESSDQKNLDVAADTSVFHPPFSVPESLLQNLPPSDKVHQIIARTALFVGEHGGQSEIILRVKQGDNLTFGFLMPHHHLHPYFRYLVDHLELLKAEHDGKPQEEKTNEDQTGGALSLLGSVYGTGEDEDGAAVVDRESKKVNSDVNSAGDVMSSSHQLEQVTGPTNVAEKDEVVSKGVLPSKVKASALTKQSISSIKSVNATAVKKDGDIVASTGPVMDKLKTSSLFPVFKAEPLIVDPPSEVKRLVDRIVEIILKNGKDFETVLIEQDKKHGRFPFLLPYNQYHQYYLKVLKKAQESRLNCKSIGTEKDVFLRQDKDNKESNSSSLGSEIHDLPLDYDKKEKFKMVINKLKKDTQDYPTKETQQQSKITVDTAAAAAILQAATRGIKKPNLDILAKTSLSSASHGSSNEGGRASSPGSLPSSQRQTSSQKQMENGKPGVTIPVAKEIAKSAALAAASEADSSEAGLTREQKLKAERLRRAKMFAAMIKGGVAPLGTEPQRASSVEPPRSGVPSSANEVANREIKDREGSSVPTETTGTSNRIEMSVRIPSDDEIEKKAGKRRHYRSRKHDDSEGEDKYEGREDIDDEKDDDLRHSRKKHRSHHSSRHHRDRSKDVHKHRRKHSSSRSKESRHRHKRESSSPEDGDRHSRYKHDSSTDDEHKHRKRRHKHDSSEDEHKHRKRKHKHSRKDEDKHKGRSKTGERKSWREEVELEEGEIRTRSSDHSSSAVGDDTSTEISVDASKSSFQENAPSVPPPETTEVPDELRAKIRAMLLANR